VVNISEGVFFVQSQKSVESFGWLWTQQSVIDSTRTFHRRLFKRWGIWSNDLDGKVVADVCSGNGRHVWALNRLTNAKKIFSVELAESAAEYQKKTFKGFTNIEVIQADAEEVQFQADFIYMIEAIQHVANPEGVLKNIFENLHDNGELVVSFYLKTLTTMALEPIRFVTKKLPKQVLWWISPCLAPLFMVREVGREMGFKNARHDAYDWFASHEYQRYFTEPEILDIFASIGIEETNIIRLQKGLYKVRKGQAVIVDDIIHSFGAEG